MNSISSSKLMFQDHPFISSRITEDFAGGFIVRKWRTLKIFMASNYQKLKETSVINLSESHATAIPGIFT